MRQLFILLFTSLALSLFSGCQKNESQSRRACLRLAIASEPPQLDLRKMKDTTSGAIARMFSEGLMYFNFQSEIVPGLAESYSVDETLTRYTFTLRPDLYWSDGSPLTAYDFEYSWKKTLEPRFMSEYAYMLFVIKNGQAIKEGKLPTSQLGVRVIDDRHLEIELHQPVAYFPEMLSFNTFHPIPKDIDERAPHWTHQIDGNFRSCGPFHLVEWKHNRELRLVKNPHYWDKESVHLDEIQLSIVHNESTVLSLFENSDIDFIGTNELCAIPIDAIPQWRAKGHLRTRPIAASLWYKLNTTLPILRNQKIRQALSLSIDRASIAENVMQGIILPANCFLPPAMQLNNTLIPEHAMREKSQRLFIEGMHEEGIEWSELPRLHLSFNDNEINRRVAQAIQQQWKDNLGIDVCLESVEWKVYLNKIHKMDYEIGRLGWVADFHDPMNYLEVFKYADPIRGSNNETGWEDPRYIRLIEEAARCRSKADYSERLAEAERMLVEACPAIPLFHYTINWMQSPHLKGVCVTGLGRVSFKWARLDFSDKDHSRSS